MPTFVSNPEIYPAWFQFSRRARAKTFGSLAADSSLRNFSDAIWSTSWCCRCTRLILGDGIRLFPPQTPQRVLSLAETQAFDTGLVQLTYQRTRVSSAEETVKPELGR